MAGAMSTMSNEPLICATVTTSESEIFLVDTVDTSGNARTADYLKDVVNSIDTDDENDGLFLTIS